MELPKSIESLRTSVKFKLDCKDKKDLFTLSKLLEFSKDNTIAVYQGILNRPNRQVVLKVGKKEAMEREYTIAADLASYKIPNFITFYCIFTCKNDFYKLISQDFQAVPFECKIEENGIDPLYFVLMPYYPMGTLYKYSWEKHEFQILVNVLKQIVFALCYAYSKNKFIHHDLHANNVLLRKTTKKTLSYGDGIELELKGIYAIIMDFERKDSNPIELLPCMERIIYTTISSDYSDISIAPNLHYLQPWIKKYPPGQWTPVAANALSDTIDQMLVIRFIKSEKGIKHLVA